MYYFIHLNHNLRHGARLTEETPCNDPRVYYIHYIIMYINKYTHVIILPDPRVQRLWAKTVRMKKKSNIHLYMILL